MSYRSESISTTVSKLNNAYFLPAIQREFVWKPEQICQLFDSLLRRYPIGSFLFWKVSSENSRRFVFYDFMRRFHERTARHNEPARATR